MNTEMTRTMAEGLGGGLVKGYCILRGLAYFVGVIILALEIQ